VKFSAANGKKEGKKKEKKREGMELFRVSLEKKKEKMSQTYLSLLLLLLP
jgi:hypothetical protein